MQNNTTECLVRPDAPLTWEDIVEASDRLGIVPTKHKKSRRSPAASAVHHAYGAWLTRQRLPGCGYVMSLRSLFQQLSCFRSDGSVIDCRHEQSQYARRARRLIVAAVNDPRSGLDLTSRPLAVYRRD